MPSLAFLQGYPAEKYAPKNNGTLLLLAFFYVPSRSVRVSTTLTHLAQAVSTVFIAWHPSPTAILIDSVKMTSVCIDDCRRNKPDSAPITSTTIFTIATAFVHASIYMERISVECYGTKKAFSKLQFFLTTEESRGNLGGAK